MQVGEKMVRLILRFAEAGLIHGDFNEFNLMMNLDTEDLVVIDFPQVAAAPDRKAGQGWRAPRLFWSPRELSGRRPACVPVGIGTSVQALVASAMADPLRISEVVSMEHPNAEMYFERDVSCVKDYLRRKSEPLQPRSSGCWGVLGSQ